MERPGYLSGSKTEEKVRERERDRESSAPPSRIQLKPGLAAGLVLLCLLSLHARTGMQIGLGRPMHQPMQPFHQRVPMYTASLDASERHANNMLHSIAFFDPGDEGGSAPIDDIDDVRVVQAGPVLIYAGVRCCLRHCISHAVWPRIPWTDECFYLWPTVCVGPPAFAVLRLPS